MQYGRRNLYNLSMGIKIKWKNDYETFVKDKNLWETMKVWEGYQETI